MKKISILLFVFLLGTAFVFADVVTFKVAYFVPRTHTDNPADPNDLWNIEFDQMDFTKSRFHSTSLSFSYEYFVNRQISFLIGVDTYSRKKVGTYVDYVGLIFEEGDFAFDKDFGFEGDFAISHVFDVSITPIQVSLKLAPMGRRNRFIPYIGGGAGIYLWNVRLQGDLIDFDDVWEYEDPDYIYEIYGVYGADIRDENRISFGFHAFGGLMYPVGRQMSIDAEFKYNFAKGNLEQFLDFDSFDLSGYQISLGLSYWF